MDVLVCIFWKNGFGDSCNFNCPISGLSIIQVFLGAMVVWTNDVWVVHGSPSPSLSGSTFLSCLL